VSLHHLMTVIESARGAASETALVSLLVGRSPEGAPPPMIAPAAKMPAVHQNAVS
jgi:hypothetical protein